MPHPVAPAGGGGNSNNDGDGSDDDQPLISLSRNQSPAIRSRGQSPVISESNKRQRTHSGVRAPPNVTHVTSKRMSAGSEAKRADHRQQRLEHTQRRADLESRLRRIDSALTAKDSVREQLDGMAGITMLPDALRVLTALVQSGPGGQGETSTKLKRFVEAGGLKVLGTWVSGDGTWLREPGFESLLASLMQVCPCVAGLLFHCLSCYRGHE